MVDEDVFVAPCECSGEYKVEPQLFFEPMEVLNLMAQMRLRIIHTQIIPQNGGPNIMYGEDWKPDSNHSKGGMITVLSQKV